jgi:CheY-like chemotaxis protein
MKNKKIIDILLIEDNAADSRLITETLKSLETTKNIYHVRSGTEASYFLKKQGEYKNSPRPDIIILDIKLPDKSGFEILKEIKHDEKIKDIPVIVLSSSDLAEHINESYALQASCYIKKPVELDEFIKTIRKIEDFWLNVANLSDRES